MSAEEIEVLSKVNDEHPVHLLTHLVDDEQYIIDLVREFLASIGLTKLIDYRDPDAYSAMLREKPNVKPDICIFDYRFQGKQLTGLDLTATAIQRNEDAIVFMITDYAYVPDILRFQELGGFLWVEKSRRDFQNHFIYNLQRGVKKLETLYKTRAALNKVEIPIIDERKPFLSDEKATGSVGGI